MRVVWLLGGDSSHAQQLQHFLSRKRTGQDYLVRQAERVNDFPQEHLAERGVVILIDAFHSSYMGFAAVEELKVLNCKARCFLLGEPAREQASTPFAHEFFCGYFPPLDRVDFAFLSGVIHHSLFLDGKIEIKNFLSDVGKCSTEEIVSMTDFLRFEKLLRTFATKFKVDGDSLKKILMAITLQHTKSAGGKVAIQDRFLIYFGIDSQKLVIGVPTMSRGHNASELRAELVKAIAAIGDGRPPVGSICPEIYHSVHSAETLLHLSGSARSEEVANDPCFLITRIHFPVTSDKNTRTGYGYAQHQVVKTDEHDETWARMKGNGGGAASASFLNAKPAEIAPPVQSSSELAAETSALQSILEEPLVVTGDPVPTSKAPLPLGEGGLPQPEVSAEATAFESGDMRTLNMALYELNKVCAALSKDVHVMMKNRREPSTDKELRASKEKLEANVKRLSGEIQKYQKIIKDKDVEIEELKERVKRLMANVQSAA